jgi:hypothetical protein
MEKYMQKQLMIVGIIVIFITVGLSGCNEQGKFLGTWQYSAGGTITFNNDNTAIINNIGLLGLTEFIGTTTYEIGNNQVTFTYGSLSVSLNYYFQDSNTLVLTSNAGDSITLIKE